MKLSIFPLKQSAFVWLPLTRNFLKRKQNHIANCHKSFGSSSRDLATSTSIVSPSITPRWRRNSLVGTETSDLEPKQITLVCSPKMIL